MPSSPVLARDQDGILERGWARIRAEPLGRQYSFAFPAKAGIHLAVTPES
jgi:hypothetical protein